MGCAASNHRLFFLVDLADHFATPAGDRLGNYGNKSLARRFFHYIFSVFTWAVPLSGPFFVLIQKQISVDQVVGCSCSVMPTLAAHDRMMSLARIHATETGKE
jgi:hypothetical protein